DRPRREPRVAVRVEGMIDEEIGAGEGAALLVERVLHRRVRLERHVELEPVPEDRRDPAHPGARDRLAVGGRPRGGGAGEAGPAAPSGWRTMCCLTRPVSRSLSTPIVSVARSTSYSPAWSLRALPRTRVSVMNAARLRITPASRSAAATPRTPRWAGISTTTPPASSAGAGVKISQASTVASTAAPRVRALGRGRNPMILRV